MLLLNVKDGIIMYSNTRASFGVLVCDNNLCDDEEETL